jgi:hypothetical protein
VCDVKVEFTDLSFLSLSMYRKDDDKYNKPGNNSNRWAAVKNLLSLVGIIALIYVPVSMLLLPAASSSASLAGTGAVSSSEAATTTTTLMMTTSSAATLSTPAPANPSMPEHHPADVRRIAEMQATIVRKKERTTIQRKH